MTTHHASAAHRNDPELIRDLLEAPGTWAVVGLSDDRSRTAWPVSRFLQAELGKTIVPVHPSAVSVHGEPGYAALADIPDDTQVAVVDCFVNSGRVGAVVDDAIAQAERLGIRAIWMQLGVMDADAARRAHQAGLGVVMDACPKIEYPRLRSGR